MFIIPLLFTQQTNADATIPEYLLYIGSKVFQFSSSFMKKWNFIYLFYKQFVNFPTTLAYFAFFPFKKF